MNVTGLTANNKSNPNKSLRFKRRKSCVIMKYEAIRYFYDCKVPIWANLGPLKPLNYDDRYSQTMINFLYQFRGRLNCK